MNYATHPFKRALSLFLAILMVLSVGYTPLGGVTRASAESATITAGELVAKNYQSLTTGEQDILKSGYVTGETFTYTAPTAEDDLVTADAAAQTVSAKEFTDANGNLWIPEVAVVAYDDNEKNVALTKNDASGEYEGTFECTADSYQIRVEYRMDLELDLGVQQVLFYGPYRLIHTTDNLNQYLNNFTFFSTVAQSIDDIKSIADGLSSGTTKEAIDRLYNQAQNNLASAGLGEFDIYLAILEHDEYVGEGKSETEFLLEKGQEFSAAADELYFDFAQIAQDSEIDSCVNGIADAGTRRRVQQAIRQLRNCAEDLAETADYGWEFLSEGANPLRGDLTSADYQAVDALAQAGSGASRPEETFKNPLTAATAAVSVNVNQHTVTVVVEAYYINADNEETALDPHSGELHLLDGSKKAEIQAAIDNSGIEDDALTIFATIDPANYDRSVTELPDTLTENVTYTITYRPKDCVVTSDFELPSPVPYGYNLVLPEYPGEDYVYDYRIEGKSYLQGETYTVLGDVTVTRTQGKPWDVIYVKDIVSANYTDELTAEEHAVLDAKALDSDYIRIRRPSDKDNLVSIALEGGVYKVTAQNYASGVSGMEWTPVSGAALNEAGDKIAEFEFNGGVGEFNETDFDRVTVNYSLTVSNVTSEQVLTALNLPKSLAEQAADQKANIQILEDQYRHFEQLDEVTLRRIRTVTRNSDLSEEAKEAVFTLYDQCLDGDQLILYAFLTAYKANGLVHYYRDDNYRRVQTQVSLLQQNLGVIYNDPEFLPLLIDLDYEDKYAEIGEIINTLEGANLTDPDPAIRLRDPALAELVTAIEAAADHSSAHTDASKELKLSASVTAAAPGKAVITLNVIVRNSLGEAIAEPYAATMTVSTVKTLDDDDIAALQAKLDALVSANVDTAHYETSDGLTVAAGDQVQDNLLIEIGYGPKTFSAYYRENGETTEFATFPFDAPTVTLPVSENSAIEYRYYVNGKRIAERTYTFSVEEIDAGAIIDRETVNINDEDLKTLADQLNQAIKDAGYVDSSGALIASFLQIEDAQGNTSLVLRVSPQSNDNLGEAISKAADALISTGFKYIWIGGTSDDYLMLDSENDQIYAQAMVNAVLETGVSLDSLLTAINTDGSLNELQIDGVVVNKTNAGGPQPHGAGGPKGAGYEITHPELLGGELFETDMILSHGSSTDGALNVKLYVTLEHFGKKGGVNSLKNLRKLTAKVRKYGNVQGIERRVDITFRIPEKLYPAYMAAMLALGWTDLHDVSDMDFRTAVKFAYDTAGFILEQEGITTDTFENTAGKIGMHPDLSDYSRYYSKLRKAAKSFFDESVTTLTETDTDNKGIYAADVNYKLDELFDYFNVNDSLRPIVAESQDGVNAAVKVTLLNDASEYEALILDPKAPGVTRKFTATKDLPAKIGSLGSNAVVILLKDINGDLNVSNALFLDLNGFKVNGSLNAGARTVVLDSRIESASGAGITGSVSGSAILTAGKYESDVSAFLKAGYVQESGLVHNGLYVIDKAGEDGYEVRVIADHTTANAVDKATLKAMVLELGGDLALNQFYGSTLSIGGNTVYNAQIDDVLDLIDNPSAEKLNELLDMADCAGITALANQLFDDFTAFETMAGSIDSGSAFATYDVVWNPWDIEADYNDAEDYITFNVMPGNETKTRTFEFRFDSADNDKFKSLFETFVETDIDGKDTLEIQPDEVVSLNDLNYASKTVKGTGEGALDLTFHLRRESELYVFVVAAILANGAPEKTDAIIDGLDQLKNMKNTGALKAAIESTTTAELLDSLQALAAAADFSDIADSVGLSDYVSDDLLAEVIEKGNDALFFAQIAYKAIVNGYEFDRHDNPLSLYETEYGIYSIEKSKSLSKSMQVFGGYRIAADFDVTQLKMTIELFNQPKKIVVTDKDGKFLLDTDSLAEAFENVPDEGFIYILDNVTNDGDEEVPYTVTLVTDDKLDSMEGHTITLTDPAASLTSDKQLQVDSEILSFSEEYYVLETENADGTWTYTLEPYKIIVYDENDEIVLRTDSLKEAFDAVAGDGYTIEILADVTADDDVTLSYAAEVTGAGDHLDLDGKTITLDAEDAELTIDMQLAYDPAGTTAPTVLSGLDNMKVKEEEDASNGTWIYSLELGEYTVTWLAEDGVTVLELDENVPEGTDPSFDGEEPTKDPDENYHYIFAWDPELVPVTQDATYTATFTAEAHVPADAVEENVTEPTCTQPGSHDEVVYCSVCGYEISRETVTDDALGHDWGDWEETTAPTCTEQGEETRTCNRCGETETRPVDALGHDFGDWIETTPPTCTEQGEETRTCNRCGETETRPVDALGHDYQPVVTEPTCTEQGYTTYTCSRCGDSYEDDYVDALGHDWGDWVETKAPTCTEKGEETRTCNRCGLEETRETDALGHNWTEWMISTEPTCTETGKQTRICQRCGEVETEILDALGHDYQPVVTEPTCTEQGYTTYTCSRCGDSYQDDFVDALGHDWGDWVQTKEPTCTEKGEETRTCNRCGLEETRELDELGHDWSDWVQNKEPTCTEEGQETRICNRCDEIETRPIDALGHDWGDWVETKAPTCNEAGEETHTCNRCGETETRPIDPTDHDWQFVQITWVGYEAFADYVCGNDASHTKRIEATVTNELTTEPTCEADGLRTYTATVTAEQSPDGQEHTATRTKELSALGHDWGEPTYEWAADNSSVTATRVCQRDSSHVETETVNTSATSTATCTEGGNKTYTATFTNPAFETQTKTVADSALGHDYVATVTPPTCTVQGVTTYICSRCGDTYYADYVDELGHDWGEWTVTKEATCTEAGEKIRTCNRCGVKETETIPAIGHDYELTGWTWNGYTSAIATFTCKNDPSHKVSVPATIVRTDEPDKYIYTATAIFEGETYTDTKEEPRSYLITFQGADGSVLQSSDVPYGQTPAYTGETPTKPATAQYTYTFAGWEPEIGPVTGEQVYKPKFTETLNKYTVEFKNEDGTVLQSGEVEYGKTPSYTGATPTKPATAQYSYTFKGWDPTISAVTGNATYTATYDQTVNKYTVEFKNEDGSVLQSGELEYGQTPSYTGATPTKPDDGEKYYTFSGWDPEIAPVTGNVTYTPKFTESIYPVVVTDKNGNITYKGDDLNEAFTKATDGSTIKVNAPVQLNSDVTLNKDVKLVGADNVDFNGKTITLKTGGKLTVDKKITDSVASGEKQYKVKESGSYVYELEQLAKPTIGTPTGGGDNNPIRVLKADTENLLIYLDVQPNGITGEEFKTLVTFPVENADKLTVTPNGAVSYQGRALIPNGSTVTVTASNSESGLETTLVYTVIIMGDTNCNGRTDSGDALLMMNHYQKTAEMSGYPLLAADMNQNGRVDSGDASKNATKYQLWDAGQYVSALKP